MLIFIELESVSPSRPKRKPSLVFEGRGASHYLTEPCKCQQKCSEETKIAAILSDNGDAFMIQRVKLPQ
jgi:hypothetical protein